MDMWWVWRLLNSWRRLAANWASSLTRVSSSWLVDTGEFPDGLEFPDIAYRWKTQRGSRQKVVWVWLCSSGGHFLSLWRLVLFRGTGGLVVSTSLRFHVGGGRFQ